MYELNFNKGFKKELKQLPSEIYPIINRQLEKIKKNPYEKNPNATRMKNVPKSYRVTIGKHVRMLYRIYDKQKRIEINGIRTRENVYDHKIPGNIKPTTPDEHEKILMELKGSKSIPRSKSISSDISSKYPPEMSLKVTCEELHWVTEDDLFLLHIPPSQWSAIIKASSVEGLNDETIDPQTKVLIEDYWTNPSPSQSEKLYTLGNGFGVENIASQPLSHFLIALDPDQRQALKKIKNNGPYLIKGSAGTGKTLVGLYHVRDLIMSRAAESLFDQEEAKFGIITYTNTLGPQKKITIPKSAEGL